VWEGEVLVEIGGSSDVPVGFVDCVEEVGGYYYDVDAAAVEDVFWGAGLRLWRAGADGDSIVYGLYPACYQL